MTNPDVNKLSAGARESVAQLMRHAQFTIAAAAMGQLPPDIGAEVAFVGRSNAGKSTLINKLTGQRALARTSKSPGRTRQLVVFSMSERERLIDLPGYGFASAPRAEQAKWQMMIPEYLSTRRCLQGVCLLSDIRRPMGEIDCQALDLLSDAGLPCVIVLTKADKLGRGAGANARAQVLKIVETYANVVDVVLFSSLKQGSRHELLKWLAHWLLTDSTQFTTSES